MKHKYTNIRLALTLAAALAGIPAAQAGTEQAVRTYDTSALRSEGVTAEGVQYTRLSWEGLEMTAGEPELPVEYVRFLVPVYTTNFTATVSGVTHGSALQTMYRIYPGQEPVTTNHEGPVPFTAPLESAYTLTLPVRAEVVSDGFVDGCNHIVTVAVYPTTYSPTNGTVMPASRLTVTLNYDDCTAADLKDTPIFPPHRSRHIDVGGMVVNAQRMSSRQYAPAPAPLDTMSDRYYIITPRSLAASFRDLAAWKRQKGYDVVIKPIEEVYEEYPYGEGQTHSCQFAGGGTHSVEVVDEAASLRTYLQDEFSRHGSFFCLLAGDYHTNMPIRKAVWKYGNDDHRLPPYPHDNGEYACPTDNYFIDLTTNWDLQIRDNLTIWTGDEAVLKFNWSIPVGRLLCSTSEEIERYTRKLMLYEANPGYGKNDYLTKALFFESCNTEYSSDGSSSHTSCMISVEDSKPARIACNHLFDIVFVQDPAHQTRYHQPLDSTSLKPQDGPTGTYLVQWIGKTGFSSWHGHGSPYGVICSSYCRVLYTDDSRADKFPYNTPNAFYNTPGSGLTNLTNYDCPAVVYSGSCDNAPFDALVWMNGDEATPLNEMNLGAAFTTAGDYGGPAAIMNTRAGLMRTSGIAESKFINALKDCPIIGAAHCASKQQLDGYHVRSTVSLIGDPEFNMWLDKPQELDITVSERANGFSLSGSCLESLRLVLSNRNRHYIYPQGSVHEGSYLTLFDGGGEYCVSIWKTGYLPIVRLMAQCGVLSDGERCYSVRDAILGFSSNVVQNGYYTVSGNGSLYVRAVDGVQLNKGFEIDRGGTVTIKCGRTAYLNGGRVKAGGKLRIEAHDVQFGPGFVVEPGGTIDIQIKK